MNETCRKCGLSRPRYIHDPTCLVGGYCQWVEKETDIRVKVFHPTGAAEEWHYLPRFRTWHKVSFRLSFSVEWFRLLSGYHQ